MVKIIDQTSLKNRLPNLDKAFNAYLSNQALTPELHSVLSQYPVDEVLAYGATKMSYLYMYSHQGKPVPTYDNTSFFNSFHGTYNQYVNAISSKKEMRRVQHLTERTQQTLVSQGHQFSPNDINFSRGLYHDANAFARGAWQNQSNNLPVIKDLPDHYALGKTFEKHILRSGNSLSFSTNGNSHQVYFGSAKLYESPPVAEPFVLSHTEPLPQAKHNIQTPLPISPVNLQQLKKRKRDHDAASNPADTPTPNPKRQKQTDAITFANLIGLPRYLSEPPPSQNSIFSPLRPKHKVATTGVNYNKGKNGRLYRKDEKNEKFSKDLKYKLREHKTRTHFDSETKLTLFKKPFMDISYSSDLMTPVPAGPHGQLGITEYSDYGSNAHIKRTDKQFDANLSLHAMHGYNFFDFNYDKANFKSQWQVDSNSVAQVKAEVNLENNKPKIAAGAQLFFKAIEAKGKIYFNHCDKNNNCVAVSVEPSTYLGVGAEAQMHFQQNKTNNNFHAGAKVGLGAGAGGGLGIDIQTYNGQQGIKHGK